MHPANLVIVPKKIMLTFNLLKQKNIYKKKHIQLFFNENCLNGWLAVCLPACLALPNQQPARLPDCLVDTFVGCC